MGRRSIRSTRTTTSTIVAHWLGHFGVRPARRTRSGAHARRCSGRSQRGSRSGRVAWQFARDYAGRARTASQRSAPPRPQRVSARPSVIDVAAAVLMRPDGRVLLAQRPPARSTRATGSFPAASSSPARRRAQALARELHEELGIDVERAAPWLTRVYVYPHAHVGCTSSACSRWRGEPHGREGQAFAWQRVGRARRRAAAAGERAGAAGARAAGRCTASATPARSARTRSSRALARRLGGAACGSCSCARRRWPRDRLAALGARGRARLVRDAGARVLVNGDDGAGARDGPHGVHLTAAQLGARRRAAGVRVVGASCPRRAASSRRPRRSSSTSRCSGRSRATPTHPRAATLGWDGFERDRARRAPGVRARRPARAATCDARVGARRARRGDDPRAPGARLSRREPRARLSLRRPAARSAALRARRPARRPATRYCSVAHAPRSISLAALGAERPELRSRAVHATCLPQRGQGTIARATARSQVAERQLELDVVLDRARPLLGAADAR